MNIDYTIISEKWKQLKSFQPELSPGAVADKLKVSEAALFYSGKGDEIEFLNNDFENLLKELKRFENIKILIKNKSSVSSISGGFSVESNQDSLFLILRNPEMTLKINSENLMYGFAINSADEKSIRFFDRYGFSVFRIHLNQQTDADEFKTVIKKFSAETDHFEIDSFETKQIEYPDETQLRGFHNDWKNLENPDEFDEILEKYKISHLQALHYAPNDFFASKIRNRMSANILEEAIGSDTKLRFVTENHNSKLSFDCTTERGSWHGEWFIVFGKESQFSLNTTKITESFIVRKPGKTGIISSLQCFDGNNELIFEVYCKRNEDEPEPNEWRAMLNLFENQ